jgi:hypothetical protein
MGRSDQTEYNKQVYAEHMLKAKAEGLCSMLRCKSLAAEGKARCQFHVDRTSCRLCTRGLVHWDCNTHAIAWFEWYEDKFGVTDSRLTAYRNRFPVPRTEMVI